MGWGIPSCHKESREKQILDLSFSPFIVFLERFFFFLIYFIYFIFGSVGFLLPHASFSPAVAHGPLTTVAPPAAEHGI